MKIKKYLSIALIFAGFILILSSSFSITGFSISENIVRSSFNPFLLIGGLILTTIGAVSFKEVLREKVAESGLEGKLDAGENVSVHVDFVRHGEKDKKGNLTPKGYEQAGKYGKRFGGDAIMSFSSPTDRVQKTINQIVESSKANKKLTYDVLPELANKDEFFSKEFLKAYRGDPDVILDKWFNDGDKRFDNKTITSPEVASGFAYLLKNYIDMSGQLRKGAKVNIVNGTHAEIVESLLHEILIRYDEKGDKVKGFKKIREIGGTLGYAEGMRFKINRDNNGDLKKVNLLFRKHKYDIDMNRLNELADSYETLIKSKTQRGDNYSK